jgi:hypothetical protein
MLKQPQYTAHLDQSSGSSGIVQSMDGTEPVSSAAPTRSATGKVDHGVLLLVSIKEKCNSVFQMGCEWPSSTKGFPPLKCLIIALH